MVQKSLDGVSYFTFILFLNHFSKIVLTIRKPNHPFDIASKKVCFLDVRYSNHYCVSHSAASQNFVNCYQYQFNLHVYFHSGLCVKVSFEIVLNFRDLMCDNIII
jgi:hypothetical protein